MSERSKLTSSHLRRQAFVYLRQSSQAQLERNVESTARQYALVERAIELGFAREQVVVIDEDLGISGSGMSERSGFARLAAEVALGEDDTLKQRVKDPPHGQQIPERGQRPLCDRVGP